MDYLELAVDVRPEAVEAAADLLRHHAPGGVSIEEPFTAIDEEGRVERRSDQPVTVRAWLLADGPATAATLHALEHDLRALNGAALALRTKTVEQESWADAWKQYFPVLCIGRRIVIKPTWRRHRPRTSDVVIELDPGMAFGTGQHETTRMCLEALEQRIEAGQRVLDLGCGSGILSIAAARLGAAKVDGIDILSEAVLVASQNAQANAVSAIVRFAEGSLAERWPFDEPPSSRYDLVLSNISSRTAQELAAGILAALRPDGLAIVSGIVEDHGLACVAAFESAGGSIVERRSDGDWRLLVVQRP